MNYCGIDVSKKSSHYCIMNAERSVVARGKVGNHRVDLGAVSDPRTTHILRARCLTPALRTSHAPGAVSDGVRRPTPHAVYAEPVGRSALL
jgi:hypothetical protein